MTDTRRVVSRTGPDEFRLTPPERDLEMRLREVDCPVCGAVAGEKCVWTLGPLDKLRSTPVSHWGRLTAYRGGAA